MKVILSILIILFSLCSCQESEKENIARLVKEWDGKEIHFLCRKMFFPPCGSLLKRKEVKTDTKVM